MSLIPVEDVISIARAIFVDLGRGYTESNYQTALYYELKERDPDCRMEQEIAVMYKGRAIGWARADIVTSEHVIELKAVDTLNCTKVRAQVERYIHQLHKADGIRRTGIVINFNQRGDSDVPALDVVCVHSLSRSEEEEEEPSPGVAVDAFEASASSVMII